jgi:hypothetical protein
VASERTLQGRVARFDAEGMESLFGSEHARRRRLSPAVRRLVVDLKAEYGGEPLSRYDVELAADTGKLRTVGRPRLFQTSHAPPQLRLFVLDTAGWLKVLKVGSYTIRRARRPPALQEALFPYARAL